MVAARFIKMHWLVIIITEPISIMKIQISLHIRTLWPVLAFRLNNVEPLAHKKTLIRLRGCAGWSEYSMGAHVNFNDTAHVKLFSMAWVSLFLIAQSVALVSKSLIVIKERACAVTRWENIWREISRWRNEKNGKLIMFFYMCAFCRIPSIIKAFDV